MHDTHVTEMMTLRWKAVRKFEVMYDGGSGVKKRMNSVFFSVRVSVWVVH